jgi:hypothetical protein
MDAPIRAASSHGTTTPIVEHLDTRYLARCRLAFAAIALTMPAWLVTIMFALRVGPELALIPLGGWLGLSALIGHRAFVRPLHHYRCPRCGAPLSRMPEALPSIKFRCDACRVVWDVRRSAADPRE